ncbi:PP2C family protein-serine/threonine phosphatase [Streptomyces meridianus]|uniref:Serine/threonine-protein phosphatase n=1 Tax=Streptomyces meridianus TaxID=2938945 RepID=A0ABT0X4R1_9ACTN|nr:PP2C family protein-serine/threonine phosphatase [Streptomyces meridianus]MCM2576769.1 serine/threonine-protein phosphatase [Streptomyces meridianus]
MKTRKVPGRPLPDVTLEASPHPVVVLDEAGRVRSSNTAATLVFPALETGAPLADGVPAWLAEAHARGEGTAHGAVGDRTFRASRSAPAPGGAAWWFTDTTEQSAAEEALRRERGRTAFLVEASNQLLSSLNARRCMDTTAQLAAGHLADAAVVLGPSGRRRIHVTRAVRGGPATRELLAVDPAEVPGLADALAGFPAVPSRWIDASTVPGWLVPDGFGPVGSLMITSLPGNGAPPGALVLLRREGAGPFSEGEEGFARVFAARAGAAICAAQLYAEQSAVADLLTEDLLPPVLERIDGIELAGGYRPSRDDHRIGGDFYDLYPAGVPGGETMVVLGDVCGKGLEAAVLTGRIRTTLQALRLVEPDHERLLELLNGALLSSRHTRYATLVLASVRRTGEVLRLRLTSGGHPAPLIVRADGGVETADTSGSLIGALPEVQATTYSTELRPGETCLLFSDGITEARGGPFGRDMFGEERLSEALSHCAGMPAEAVVEHVRMLASDWLGTGRHDDMALLAITAPRRPRPGPAGGQGHGRSTA